MGGIRSVVAGVLVVALASNAAARDTAAERAALWPRPPSMEVQIAFWHDIFTRYSQNEVVLHDPVHVGRIYKVLDFRAQARAGRSEKEVAAIRERETAREIAAVRRELGLPVDRVRGQRGLREQFIAGIQRSRRYLPTMERIFRERGLPLELTRLPLIESSFNHRARSGVGAAGIWQLMPATGRLFVRVDRLVDERRDPIAATRAAARLLGRLHARFESWPLALTAYNHGPGGVARAVRTTGTTDLGRIVREYHGPAFGFASRNFYTEFLAAVDVERDYRRHFGDLPLDPPLRFREHRVRRAIGIAAAARWAGTTRQELVALNPALTAPVVSGRRAIPAGYHLRLPNEESQDVVLLPVEERTVVAQSRAPKRRLPKRTSVARYRVKRGETLSHIARRHRVSVATLTRVNRLRRPKLLRTGQVIKIPDEESQDVVLLPVEERPVVARSRAPKRSPRKRTSVVSYRVKRGETLSHIARRHRVSVATLRRVNRLRKPKLLRTGQVIKIPAPDQAT
jgi:peptidoglycan lytic transglycosylase D